MSGSTAPKNRRMKLGRKLKNSERMVPKFFPVVKMELKALLMSTILVITRASLTLGIRQAKIFTKD